MTPGTDEVLTSDGRVDPGPSGRSAGRFIVAVIVFIAWLAGAAVVMSEVFVRAAVWVLLFVTNAFYGPQTGAPAPTFYPADIVHAPFLRPSAGAVNVIVAGILFIRGLAGAAIAELETPEAGAAARDGAT